MKKLLILAGLLVISIAAGAQTKGQFVIDGTVGGSVVSVDGESYASFQIGAGFGYFFSDRLRAGASVACVYQDEVCVLEADVNAAYFVPLSKSIYYTPNVSLDVGTIDGAGICFGCGLGFGTFECKVSERLGISLGLLNFSLVSDESANLISLNLCKPTIGVSIYL